MMKRLFINDKKSKKNNGDNFFFNPFFTCRFYIAAITTVNCFSPSQSNTNRLKILSVINVHGLQHYISLI